MGMAGETRRHAIKDGGARGSAAQSRSDSAAQPAVTSRRTVAGLLRPDVTEATAMAVPLVRSCGLHFSHAPQLSPHIFLPPRPAPSLSSLPPSSAYHTLACPFPLRPSNLPLACLSRAHLPMSPLTPNHLSRLISLGPPSNISTPHAPPRARPLHPPHPPTLLPAQAVPSLTRPCLHHRRCTASTMPMGHPRAHPQQRPRPQARCVSGPCPSHPLRRTNIACRFPRVLFPVHRSVIRSPASNSVLTPSPHPPRPISMARGPHTSP